MTFLLRKRSLAFSDDENDATHAYPPSPSKRRRETASRQGLSLQLNLKNTTIPRGPVFVDLDVDTESVKENTRPELRSRATTPTTPTTIIDSNVGNKNRSLLQPSTPAMTTQTITPPMTPTRRSTRQSTSPPSRKNITYACENSAPPHPNSQQQSIPTTPKRKSSVLKEQSPSFSNTNNNSTGLTPAMNRMLKRPRVLAELNTPNANAPVDITETRKTGYATPKRMSRTRCSLEPLSNSPSSSIRRTLSSNNLSSESTVSLSEPQLRRHTSAATGTSTTLGYYQDAKALFRRTTEPQRLVGRVAERETIRQFCLNHILTPEAGSLYISGQPGTGKTALLKEIVRDMQPAMEKAPYAIKVLTINCMTVKDPKLVYHKMLVELGYKSEVGDKEAAINALETLILGDKKNKIM
ncbi:AAA ATPase [Linnemannia hyalina]|uniref:AAA ATPase n=1 Tax=Linnemannia hyalina TaxID=64524 RepID=A0A9P7Y0J0_9FUNG|nr:AAA ATPase [Linnemannia hyalina]